MLEIDGISYLTVQEAADRIGVDPSQVRRYIRLGQLKTKNLSGRFRLIKESDVNSFERTKPGPKKRKK